MDVNHLLGALESQRAIAIQRRSDALLALGEAAHLLWKQCDTDNIPRQRLSTERNNVERQESEIQRIEVTIAGIKKVQQQWKPAEASHAS